MILPNQKISSQAEHILTKSNNLFPLDTPSNNDRNNYFVFGVVNMTVNYPKNLNLNAIEQQGFFIGSRKNTSNIDGIGFTDLVELHFNVGREHTYGFLTSTNHLKYPDGYVDTVKHYSAILNLFGYNVNSEIMIKLPILERKVIGGISFTLFNFGLTGIYLSGGRYDKRILGAIDFVPFYTQVYARLSLKNATIGIGVYVNPYNFVEFRFGPKDLIGEDSGIITSSAQFPKSGFIFYVYLK